jgi:PAS domain S-box-containing protein
LTEVLGRSDVATNSYVGVSPAGAADPQAGGRNTPEGSFQTVWETDAAGFNLYQSPSWYDYIGEGPGSSFGQGWLDYYHPDDRPALMAAWTRSLRSPDDEPYDIEARIRRHDGTYRWFRIQGAPLRTRDGRLIKWVGTCTDIEGANSRGTFADAPADARPRAGRKWFTGLERRLFLIGVVATLPMIAIAAYTLNLNAQDNKSQVLESAESQVRALTTAVDTELNLSIASLQAMAVSSRVIAVDVAGVRREALAYLDSNPRWANIILHAPDGRQLMNAQVPEGASLPRTPVPDLITAVRADRRAHAGSVIYSEVLKKAAVGMAVPVLREGELVGVLSAVMLPQAWQSLVDRQKLPPGAVLGVFDAKQHVVARSADPESWVGKPGSSGLIELVRRQAESGWGETQTLEGKPVFTVYSRSEASGWSAAVGLPKSYVDEQGRRAIVVLGGATVLSICASLLAASYLARTIARPMRELEQAAAASAIGRAPTIPSTDLSEIRNVAISLFTAHTEREKLLQSERQARQSEHAARVAAEEANRSKDRFLAMVGHELRGPLSAISVARELMALQAPSETSSRTLDVIKRQVLQLTRITDDLMDAGAVLSGNVALRRAPVDFGACVSSVVEGLRATPSLAAHTVRCSAPSAWVKGDPGRLEQIVSNLVVNAGKYTPPPGTIDVRVAHEGDDIVLRVRDSGIGLDASLRDRVFELFVQGPQQAQSGPGGLGIGLAVVRRLTELHGGTIDVFSEGVGRGSEFVVRLPAIAPPVDSGGGGHISK